MWNMLKNGKDKLIARMHHDESAVAEHSIHLGHSIQFQDTGILITKTGRMKRVITEAIEDCSIRPLL
jgi:hypothetical protein